MNGKFRGTIEGTFETGGFPVAPVAAVLAAAAVIAWLLTVIVILAVIAAVVLLSAGGLFWLVSRRNPRDAELLAERWPGVHAEAACTAAPKVVENHYHLHLPPGASAPGADWTALPLRDAATITEEER